MTYDPRPHLASTVLRSSAWTAPIAVAMQVNPVSASSAISIGLMVTIIGAAAWLSRVLTRSEEQLRGINEKLTELRSVPERMALLEKEVGHVKSHVTSLEADLNNLWKEWRQEDGDELDNLRRERGPRPRRT